MKTVKRRSMGKPVRRLREVFLAGFGPVSHSFISLSSLASLASLEAFRESALGRPREAFHLFCKEAARCIVQFITFREAPPLQDAGVKPSGRAAALWSSPPGEALACSYL